MSTLGSIGMHAHARADREAHTRPRVREIRYRKSTMGVCKIIYDIIADTTRRCFADRGAK